MSSTPEPVSRFFTSQRLKLHYVEWGHADAPPLLLIHGGRDHCRNWDRVAERLSRDWRIIAPDLRGHGDSQWSNSGLYTYDAWLWDLLALTEHLQLERATLVGHSLGGYIALRYAAAFPERMRKLVCIEGLGPAPADVQRNHRRNSAERLREQALYRLKLPERQSHRYDTLEQAIAHFHSRNQNLSASQAEHLASHGSRRLEDGRYAWKFDDFARKPAQLWSSEAELLELIEAVRCPVLLPWGEDSFFSLADNQPRIDRFSDARVVLYANAGHWPHHDRFEDFVHEVAGFVADGGRNE